MLPVFAGGRPANFGGSAETWLRMQVAYDLAQVRADQIKVKRLEIA